MSRKHNKQLNFLVQEVTSLFDASEFAPYDPTQEVIFPPELMVSVQHFQAPEEQILKYLP